MIRVNEMPVGLYVIVQDSREDNSKLLLADRKKTKAFWWTKSLKYAITFKRKSAAEFTLSKYKYNNARVMKLSELNFNNLVKEE